MILSRDASGGTLVAPPENAYLKVRAICRASGSGILLIIAVAALRFGDLFECLIDEQHL
jgi:hypothetical protein